MPENSIVIDTNLLLDDANIVYKLSKKYDKIVIPLVVLAELDKKKFEPNLSYSARKAIRAIREFKTEHPERLAFEIVSEFEDNNNSNDVRILRSAQLTNSGIATKDISMSIIAESMGITDVHLYDAVVNGIFNPYFIVDKNQLDELLLLETDYVFNYKDEYVGSSKELDQMALTFEHLLGRSFNYNSWFFIIIDDIKPIAYGFNPLTHTLSRIDNKKAYRERIIDGKIIKAKDIYQVCAFFALHEAPHVLITGTWGSGKTLISTAHSLQNQDNKVFISRPPVGISSRYDIGFTPGTAVEKMHEWVQGFMSALYFIYANTRSQKGNSNITFDVVRDQIFEQKFEVMPINSIQGLSLLSGDTLILDECQLLTVDYLSMVLSRPAEGSKLILLGDLGQTYDTVKPSESGLLKLLRLLPHKSLAYVNLPISYRSDIITLANELQDKTIY